MKIVVDTNVLVSALIKPDGAPAQLLSHDGSFEMVTTEEILAELERVLHYERIQTRYRLKDEIIAAYINHVRNASEVIVVESNIKVVEKDPDDDKFVACARAAQADCIVSGDPHLINLKSYQGIPILTPRQFLEIIT